MASLKQISANKENAKKSTGPISIDGKAMVACNALKHGILSKVTVLPDENENLFRKFKEDMIKNLDPKTAVEALCVDRIISCAWRLRRVLQIENFYLQDEVSLSRHRPAATAAEIFRMRGDIMATISRYEVTIERSMYKALDELQRLKALSEHVLEIPQSRIVLEELEEL